MWTSLEMNGSDPKSDEFTNYGLLDREDLNLNFDIVCFSFQRNHKETYEKVEAIVWFSGWHILAMKKAIEKYEESGKKS